MKELKAPVLLLIPCACERAPLLKHGRSVTPLWCGLPSRLVNKRTRVKRKVDSPATVGGGDASYWRRKRLAPVLTLSCEGGIHPTLKLRSAVVRSTCDLDSFLGLLLYLIVCGWKALHVMPKHCCVPLCKSNGLRNPELCYLKLPPKENIRNASLRNVSLTREWQGQLKLPKHQVCHVLASLHRRRIQVRNETQVAAFNSRAA